MKEREKAIVALIGEMEIGDQETLVRLLKERGIDTNQAQVSRDLRRLGIGKKKGIYEGGEIDKALELMRLGVREVVRNEVMVVVKTYPGLADFIGDYLDDSENEEILATLAGENVVFVTPVTIKRIKETYELVCKTLHYRSPL